MLEISMGIILLTIYKLTMYTAFLLAVAFPIVLIIAIWKMPDFRDMLKYIFWNGWKELARSARKK